MKSNTMAVTLLLLMAVALAGAATGTPGTPGTPGSLSYYALELRGGSRLFSADKPVRKGKVVLFHRYPDGAFVSLPASEVVSTAPIEAPPKPEGEKLAPGAMVYVGPALEGPRYDLPAPAEPPADYGYGSGYGYSDYGYGYGYGGGGYLPPRPPGPVPPSRIGSNGYPIIAPPGTPGSVQQPIGSNGYPILAPPPPVAVPLPRR
jgi:hypothetical protein